jgi:ectoine hydroxylase-related dioxygenase (phytanoyl-CoA dioxygenase family)
VTKASQVDTARVAAQFNEYGCLGLQKVFPPALIADLHAAFVARYGAMTAGDMQARCDAPGTSEILQTGGGRYEIAPTMDPPFSDPRIYANELVLSVLDLLLGDGYKISSFTIVVSFPGAEEQHVHRDHSHLFERESIGLELPSHAINLAIPLVDIDPEMGPTELWPGSHRWEPDAVCDAEQMVAPTLRAGDCMMIDYRTLHAGAPNRSTRIRPILYVVYARPWFFDEKNFTRRNPLDLPEAEYAKLAPPVQEIMSRASRLRQLNERSGLDRR